MGNIVSHLDITQIFCEVDDFCQSIEKHCQGQVMLPSMIGERKSCLTGESAKTFWNQAFFHRCMGCIRKDS